VKVSTTPDGRVLDLFFITDARSTSYLPTHPFHYSHPDSFAIIPRTKYYLFTNIPPYFLLTLAKLLIVWFCPSTETYMVADYTLLPEGCAIHSSR
jgi:hypothetical protein